MADFHQPRFVPTLHALGTRRLGTADVAMRARATGTAVTLVLPALAAELDGIAFPRILRLLADSPLLDRVILVLGHATPRQRLQARTLLSTLGMKATLVSLDDDRLQRVRRRAEAADIAVDPTGKGYACWVGMSVALAGPGSDVIAMHDCDIVTYHPDMLARLVSPLVVPESPFDFAKGYYARVTSMLYGRVTRLLVTPLLRALQHMELPSTLPAFLADFRYPLAGEVAFTRRLAEALPLHGGWGLEIGTLAEIYRRQRTFRACQVDIADAYDHRHRPMAAGPGGGDLTAMTTEVLAALVRALRQERVTCDAASMRYALAHYRAEVARSIDAYAADAAINGLSYDREAEAGIASSFATAIEACLADGLRRDTSVHPSWTDLRRLAPGACEAFAEMAHDSMQAPTLDRPPVGWAAPGLLHPA